MSAGAGRAAVLALGVLLSASAARAQAPETLGLPRADGATVAARAFRPQGECVGTAIVSHGAGGSVRGYRYLAEAVQHAGWLALTVGHDESGLAALGGRVMGRGLHGGLLDLVTDPAPYRTRFMDLDAALAWARAQCPGKPAVLLGHSMGAATALLEAGARNRLGLAGRDAYDAYVALSPQGPGSIFPEHAWEGIAKPVLFVTGTRDAALEGDWTTRLRPFEDVAPGCKWLGVVDGATHLNFAGLGSSAETERLTALAVAAFLDGISRRGCGTPPDVAGLSLRTR